MASFLRTRADVEDGVEAFDEMEDEEEEEIALRRGVIPIKVPTKSTGKIRVRYEESKGVLGRPYVWVILRRADPKKGFAKRQLLLDTGASKTAIPAQLIRMIRPPVLKKKVVVRNASGPQRRDQVRISVATGSVDPELESSRVELTASVRTGGFKHGVLGMDWVHAIGMSNLDFINGREEGKAEQLPTKKKEKNKKKTTKGNVAAAAAAAAVPAPAKRDAAAKGPKKEATSGKQKTSKCKTTAKTTKGKSAPKKKTTLPSAAGEEQSVALGYAYAYGRQWPGVTTTTTTTTTKKKKKKKSA